MSILHAGRRARRAGRRVSKRLDFLRVTAPALGLGIALPAGADDAGAASHEATGAGGSAFLALAGAIVLCTLAAVAFTVHTRRSFRRKLERFQRVRAGALVPRHIARAELVECFFDAPAGCTADQARHNAAVLEALMDYAPPEAKPQLQIYLEKYRTGPVRFSIAESNQMLVFIRGLASTRH